MVGHWALGAGEGLWGSAEPRLAVLGLAMERRETEAVGCIIT
jgi:hypothetical protein